MEDRSFSTRVPLAAPSDSGAAELERCYRNRWINEPERNLMLAVLEDAIRCFLGYRDGDNSARNRLAYADARDWINSKSRYSIFSFCNLCEIIGINPDSLRRELHHVRQNSSRRVALQRTFDVRSPSMSSSRAASATSARTRRARAPMASPAKRAQPEAATVG
jgi:hypothetical protein